MVMRGRSRLGRTATRKTARMPAVFIVIALRKKQFESLAWESGKSE